MAFYLVWSKNENTKHKLEPLIVKIMEASQQRVEQVRIDDYTDYK